MWSFDDSTPLLEDVGLISAQTKQHSFASPGMYSVTVNTRNDAGVSQITISVPVLGKSHTSDLATLQCEKNGFLTTIF